MDINDAIQTKRAVRNYKKQEIPDDAIYTVINAGRRAQSSKNTQPWHFIVIKEESTLSSLSKMGKSADHIAKAAFAVAVITPDPDTRFSIMFDAGQSGAYMQLAAWGLGIGSCLATIYEPEKARDLLGFSDDLHIRIAISFGYPVDESVITRPPAKVGRKPIEETVHWEKW